MTTNFVFFFFVVLFPILPGSISIVAENQSTKEIPTYVNVWLEDASKNKNKQIK